jgi:hypothetical protein
LQALVGQGQHDYWKLVNIKFQGGKVMRKLFLFFVLFFMAYPVGAKEIEGVAIDEQITAEDGAVLQLNGAGIRKKVFFKIYIAQLYLQNPATETAQIISDDGRKRIVMHFLYDKVEKEKLVAGWNEGFAANSDPAMLAALQPRIDTFNAMFDEDAVKGDRIVFDYLPGKGTAVMTKGKDRGIIEGKDFNDALLSIWLGKNPISTDLREALLQK